MILRQGPLTYSANWDAVLAVDPCLWRALDFIGVSAYFPLRAKIKGGGTGGGAGVGTVGTGPAVGTGVGTGAAEDACACTCTSRELVDGWAPVKASLGALAAAVGRPVLFTEVRGWSRSPSKKKKEGLE